jgi:hypothetical protein
MHSRSSLRKPIIHEEAGEEELLPFRVTGEDGEDAMEKCQETNRKKGKR